VPRSSVAFTREPVDIETLAAAVSTVLTPEELAATAVEIRPIDDGAAAQVIVAERVVLTVLRPRLTPPAAELARVYGAVEVAPDARWSTECFATREPEGLIGVRILEPAAAARGGMVAHLG
jgi:sulfur carrier protein ThiS